MTILDELLTSTGDVGGVAPSKLASGRNVVMAAAGDPRVRVRRVSVGRKIAFAAVSAAAAAAIRLSQPSATSWPSTLPLRSRG